ncbi:MAG TPA: hypothetical protein PKH07_14360 [bacterium]|nr:hypothetical protein [bacterium]
MQMHSVEVYIPWLQTVLGVLLLYCGWLLYRVGMMCLSWCLGAIGGGCLAKVLIQLVREIPNVWWVVVIGAIVGGIVGVFLIRRLYFVALFVISGLFALNLKQTVLTNPRLFSALNLSQLERFWNSASGTVVFAVAFALLVVALHRFLVIWLTSGVGALLVADRLPWQQAVYFLAVTGVIVQLGLIRGFGIDTGRETNRWKQERKAEDS